MQKELQLLTGIFPLPVGRLHAYRSRRQGLTLSVAILTTLFFLPRIGISAQTKIAAVRGTVQDHAGVPIQATTVTAKNLETGLSRTVSSNEKGEFEILPLDPGIYEVHASRSDSITQTPVRVELEPGRSVEVKLVLAAGSGELEQETETKVQESATSSSAGTVNLISEDQLVGLPLNGRSYSQLATLQAGVSDPSTAAGARGVGGGGLTVAGGRSTSNTFLLDGTNIMDTGNRVPRSAAGVQLGSDAVLQVQVFSANYGPSMAVTVAVF